MDAIEQYRQRRKHRLVNRMRQAAEPAEARRLAIIICNVCYPKDGNTDGGSGSGNWGHEGRPGEVGGSAEGGGTENRQGSSESGYTSSAKKEEYKAKLKSEKESLLSEDESDQALTMYKKGYLSHDEAVDAMNDGSISGRVEEYYSILEENGDTTSEKPTTKENKNSRNEDVDSGKYASHQEAREGYIKEMTGLSDEECQEISKQADVWVSNSWDKADTASIDKFIENDHTYEGTIYRGLHFGEGEESTYDDFMSSVQVGSTISASQSGKNASWSSSKNDATGFSHKTNDWEDSAIIRCVANRTSSPIAYLNNQGEQEVVSHSKAQWTVLNVQVTEKRNGGRHAEITVIERGEYASGSNGDGIMNKDDNTNKGSEEELKPMSMYDRWKASSKDFVATPPKKEYRKNSSESKSKKN